LEVARLVGRDDAQLVVASELIARIAVQTCLCSGTSAVYMDLMDFANSEFYVFDAAPVVGASFGQAVLRYEAACLVGLIRADGTLLLAPGATTPIVAGDRLVMVAETDDPLKPGPAVELALPSLPAASVPARCPVRTLLLGWNREARAIVRELDAAVLAGSELVIVADHVPADLAVTHQRLVLRTGDAASRAVLAALDPAAFDHVIVLGLTEVLDAQEADARTLVTLLHLRTILDGAGGTAPTVVAEMVDPRNRDLARAARVDDFIASDKLVSLMLAQLSENPQVEAVFAELLRPGGCVIRIRPATEYPGADFRAVSAAALARGEVAIGVRRPGALAINPAKGTRMLGGPDEQIVVLAHTAG
jgi:voltage-gated potassium channel Kch